jgi:PAS domain S-box-containing protein
MKPPRRSPASIRPHAQISQRVKNPDPLLEHAPIAYLLLNTSGIILEANHSSARLLSRELRQLPGLALRDLVKVEDRYLVDRHIEECLRCKVCTTPRIRLDGSDRPAIELNSSSYRRPRARNVFVQTFMVLRSGNGSAPTEEGIVEQKLQKLTRMLKALAKGSQAMVRAEDESEYMNEVCRIVQEDCGHAMVWIGFARDDEARSVVPVAYAGFDDGYLQSLKLTWADVERGRGPTGTAIRTGMVCRCRNMCTDARFSPWREEAAKRGYAASIALPLKTGGKVFGALTIYSREADPFSADDEQLLSELTNDLASGLTTVRLRAAHLAAEKSLQMSEERHRALFENMTEGFALHEIITDSHGTPVDYRFLEVNPSFEKLTGLKQESLVGKRVLEILPDNERTWIEQYGRVALTGEPVHFENYSAPLGRWYEVFAYRPAPMQFAAIFKDTTQRRHAEVALAENLQRLEAHIDNSPLAVIEFDPEFQVIRWSHEAERLFGWTAAEITGHVITHIPLVHEEDAELVRKVSAQMLTGEQPRNVNVNRNRCKDGTIVLCEWYNSALYDTQGRMTSILSLVLDITERKRAVETLRLSEEKFALAFANNPAAIAVTRLDDGVFVDVNNTWTSLMGYSREDALHHSVAELRIWLDQESRVRFVGELKEQGSVSGMEQEFRKKSGEKIVTQLSAQILKVHGESLILSTFIDITERKKMEVALRESRHKIQEILEGISDGFWAVDSQWRFVYINKRAAHNVGYTAADLIGKSLWEMFPRIQGTIQEYHYRKVMLEREASHFEHQGVLSSEVYSFTVYPSGEGISVYWQNITSRKLAERELTRTTERFALLSETAGALLASSSPQTVVEELCRKVMANLDCEFFFNFLVEEETQRLHLNACAGIPAAELEKVEWVNIGTTVCGCVARDHERIIVNDVQRTREERTALIKSFGIQAYCCHPLISGNKVLGTLSFGSKHRQEFSGDDVELMRIVSDQVSVALERIRAEKAQRDSEERLQAALQVSRSFAFEWIPATDRVHRSMSCAPLLGLTENEAGEDSSQNFFRWIDPVDREHLVSMISQLKPEADRYNIKYRYNRPDGGVTVLEEGGRGFFDANGTLVRLVGVTTDVTARERAEQAQKASEERFRLAIRHSKLMAWQCDMDMRFTWIYNSHFGAPDAQLLGKTPEELGNEKGMAEFIAHGSEVRSTGKGSRRTIKHTSINGSEQYFDQQIEVYQDPEGRTTRLIGISLDVTDRVIAEQRVHKSEESFRLMIGHSGEPMLLVGPTGIIDCISRRAAEQLGYHEAELIGTSIERFLDWSGKLDLAMRLEDFLRHAPSPAQGVLRVKHRDGSWRWIDVDASFVNYGQQPEKYLLKFETIDTVVAKEGV